MNDLNAVGLQTHFIFLAAFVCTGCCWLDVLHLFLFDEHVSMSTLNSSYCGKIAHSARHATFTCSGHRTPLLLPSYTTGHLQRISEGRRGFKQCHSEKGSAIEFFTIRISVRLPDRSKVKQHNFNFVKNFPSRV